ncbi:hypothetical protein PHMEG_00027018 [Phytophthora megakarya]|uniref:Uncharacterized protein n=1 Tax=Phytophthora megakarya TaxID=4795 RepID=A0A225V862_9STRA|nr:hypothetical protein PHMEG_00027018 [Phytophthora megakarya]
MATLPDLDGLMDSNYLVGIRTGMEESGELEIYAAAHMHSWDIEEVLSTMNPVILNLKKNE